MIEYKFNNSVNSFSYYLKEFIEMDEKMIE